MAAEERPPPEPDDQAITRELWLLRGSGRGKHDTEEPDSLGQSKQAFDWYRADADTRYASPAVIAEFHHKLRDIRLRQAETQAAREEESLRASRVANRFSEEECEKRLRRRSRASTVRLLHAIVRLLRSIVLLIALSVATAVLFLGVLTTKLTPGAVLNEASKLINFAETAIGVEHKALRADKASASPLGEAELRT